MCKGQIPLGTYVRKGQQMTSNTGRTAVVELVEIETDFFKVQNPETGRVFRLKKRLKLTKLYVVSNSGNSGALN